jgi:hypothetical protein
MARASGRTTAARKTAARKTAARKTVQRPRKKAAAASRRTSARPAVATTAAAASSSGGVADLAGGMRSMLTSIENEVRAVSALSEQIDALVAELNTRRDEQAARLLALDALRASVTDPGLNAFLDKAIRPRRTRVPEIVPERLTD